MISKKMIQLLEKDNVAILQFEPDEKSELDYHHPDFFVEMKLHLEEEDTSPAVFFLKWFKNREYQACSALVQYLEDKFKTNDNVDRLFLMDEAKKYLKQL